jgi:hypothetical protein
LRGKKMLINTSIYFESLKNVIELIWFLYYMIVCVKIL